MQRDPNPYDGPIERVDGVRPFNRYLWPTEQWAYARETGKHVDFSMRIEIVELSDGRFATSGSVYLIERGYDHGLPCVFCERSVAIRNSAARMIRYCRIASRGRWRLMGLHLAPEIITWARETVARETGSAIHRNITFRMPAPPPQRTGLPLFDLEIANG